MKIEIDRNQMEKVNWKQKANAIRACLYFLHLASNSTFCDGSKHRYRTSNEVGS